MKFHPNLELGTVAQKRVTFINQLAFVSFLIHVDLPRQFLLPYLQDTDGYINQLTIDRLL